MQSILNEKLKTLASSLSAPLYIVGGFTRDYLSGLSSKNSDVDLCAPVTVEEFLTAAKQSGFTPLAVYKNTGTVKLSGEQNESYEFTCFRSDKYVRGLHKPSEIFFTNDIVLDAKRRDFTANAVYYDVREEHFVDPLGGIRDIQEKKLRTVADADKVFGEDGLRLMRLARQAAQTGFTPTDDCLLGAKKNADLILDIVAERIFSELCSLLTADEKYGVTDGHYQGLRILEKSGILEKLFPELQLGKNMAQRADFHDHDVLEHTFRAVLYADPCVRLAALFHDVAKPTCFLQDGDSHAHPVVGEKMTREILTRLKASNKTIDECSALVRWHMYDFDGKTKETKLRRFFVEHANILQKLMLLKQADYSGCKDDISLCPTNRKWQAILSRMKEEQAPLSLKDLRIKGNELIDLGVPKQEVSIYLKELLLLAVNDPTINENERLKKLSLSKLKRERKKETNA